MITYIWEGTASKIKCLVSLLQPLFQVPLTIAASQIPVSGTSQQVYIQQNTTQDDDTTEIIQVKAPS